MERNVYRMLAVALAECLKILVLKVFTSKGSPLLKGIVFVVGTLLVLGLLARSPEAFETVLETTVEGGETVLELGQRVGTRVATRWEQRRQDQPASEAAAAEPDAAAVSGRSSSPPCVPQDAAADEEAAAPGWLEELGFGEEP